MRLVAADAERDAYVANITRHEIIEPQRLFGGSVRALGERVRFFSHGVIDRHALALQLCVPLRHLLPVGKSRQLNVRMVLFLFTSFSFLSLITLRLSILRNPRVN